MEKMRDPNTISELEISCDKNRLTDAYCGSKSNIFCCFYFTREYYVKCSKKSTA